MVKKSSGVVGLWSMMMLAPVSAQQISLPDEVTIYGKVEVQALYSDSGEFNDVDKGKSINSAFSRLGVSGEHPLNESVSLLFTMEWEVLGFDDANKDTPFAARNTYAGLSSPFGTVLLGRNDTRFKKSEGNVDLFKETEGCIKQIFAGQDRLGDTVTYSTPKWQQLQLEATVAMDEDAQSNGEDDGYALSLTFGDSKLKNSPYYLAAAMADSLNGFDGWRAVAVYDFSLFRVGGMYQHSEKPAKDKEGDGFMVNVGVPFAGSWMAKLQYSQDDARLVHAEDAELYSAGIDYRFDANTKVYLMGSHLELDSSDDTVSSIGLQYFF